MVARSRSMEPYCGAISFEKFFGVCCNTCFIHKEPYRMLSPLLQSSEPLSVRAAWASRAACLGCGAHNSSSLGSWVCGRCF